MIDQERIFAAVRKRAMEDLATDEHKPTIELMCIDERFDGPGVVVVVQWTRGDVDPDGPGPDDALYTVSWEDDELIIDGPEW